VIAVIGLLVGVAIGIVWHPAVPLWLEPYLPIAIVAALDAVAGGFRALVEKRFDERIFVVSFLSNVLIASLLVFLGDRLGVGAQMSTGVVVVLAMRIFANAAAIRRALFRA
jgi:small basic protein